MTGRLAVPHRQLAEKQVAAAIVSNPKHVRGVDELTPGDFYSPRLGRLFAQREVLADIQFLDDRIRVAADRADIEQREVDRLVSATSRMWDFTSYARQVKTAANSRRLMSACLEGFNGLGQGEPFESVLAMLRKEVAA